MKSLPLEIVQTIREWVKQYVTDNSFTGIVVSVNFETGNVEYITDADGLTFDINTLTGNMEYWKS